MKFTLEGAPGAHLIHSYSAEGIRVGDTLMRSSCIVTADRLLEWPVPGVEALTAAHFEPLFALQPELVLLGTGKAQRFPPGGVRAAFAERRVALEPMDLGAACRTFNILLQEQRRVAAALLWT